MPRPTNKDELLNLAEINLNKLLEFINALPDEIKTRIYSNDELNDRDETLSDIICHLYEWHRMMESWYTIGMSGYKPKIPAEGITWQTLPVLNHQIWERYRGTDLDNAIAMLKESHERVIAQVKRHSDDELFEKKRYAWTGTTSLGAYFISSLSSHYDWALKTIKPLKKIKL
jgi:hypothetical protein